MGMIMVVMLQFTMCCNNNYYYYVEIEMCQLSSSDKLYIRGLPRTTKEFLFFVRGAC